MVWASSRNRRRKPSERGSESQSVYSPALLVGVGPLQRRMLMLDAVLAEMPLDADLRARVTAWSSSRKPTSLYRKPAAPAFNASASFAELPPPVITRTGAVTPRSRRRASKLKPRLLSESQRPAAAGMTTSSRMRSNCSRRRIWNASDADSAVVISYAHPCRNEAKKSRSTVSTIASSSTIRTRFVAVPFVVARTLMITSPQTLITIGGLRRPGRLRALLGPANAAAVVNVTRAIVAALKRVEAGPGHLGAHCEFLAP